MNVGTDTQPRVCPNTDNRSIHATTATTSLNAAMIDEFVRLLEQDNWPAVYSDLTNTRPNLASVVCAIDLLLPQAEGEAQNILGFRVVVSDQLRGYRKPTYSVMSCRPVQSHPLEELSQIAASTNSTPFVHTVYSFFSRSNQASARASTSSQAASIQHDAASERARGEPAGHAQLMQQLVKKILTETPDTNVQTSIDDAEIIDLTHDSATTMLNHVARQRTQSDNRSTEMVHKELLGSETLHNEQITLPHAIRQKVLVTCRPLAEFYSAVSAALSIRNNDPLATQRFNVASEDYLMDKTVDPSYPKQDGLAFFDTFCPNVSRQVMDEPQQPPHFRISVEGEQVPADNIVTVMDYVFHTAKQHLQVKEIGKQPSAGQCYPLMIYKTLAKALKIEVPAYLTENENKLGHQVDRNQAEFVLKTAQNEQRIALAQAETARRKEQIAREKAQLCVEHHITHPDNLILGFSSARPNSATNSVEYSHRLQCAGQDPTLFYNIQDMLGASRDHQQVASVARTLNALQNGQQFHKDNQCWLRAIWISVFDQITHPDQFNTMFSKLRLDEDPSRNYEPLLLNALWDDFKNNRHELLHRGEVGGLNKDAHFMSGRRVGEYLESKNIPIQQYKPKSMHTLVEVELYWTSAHLAMGVRGEEKPRFDSNVANVLYPKSLMNSEYVVAVHRVIEVPCFVIERSPNNQVSVIFSGAKDDQELTNISIELEQHVNNAGVRLEDLAPLFNKYKNIPVIMLNAEHYTVYLPKAQQHADLPEPVAIQTPIIEGPTVEEPTAEDPMEGIEIEEPSSPTFVQEPHSTDTTAYTVYRGQAFPIKANNVNFGDTGTALVGQTPANLNDAVLNLSKLLEQSDQNGGHAEFFEYISPLAKIAPERSRHPGSVACLKHLLQRGLQNNQIVEINGKAIVAVHPIHSHEDPEWVNRYNVEYFDRTNPNQPKFVQIVQAAPEFSRGYLNAEQLIQSLNSLRQSDAFTYGNRLLFSAMGVGRSAALAVIDKASVAIQTGILNQPDQITEWLNQAKSAGVRDRGPYFLSNSDQMIELHKAVLSLLQAHQSRHLV